MGMFKGTINVTIESDLDEFTLDDKIKNYLSMFGEHF